MKEHYDTSDPLKRIKVTVTITDGRDVRMANCYISKEMMRDSFAEEGLLKLRQRIRGGALSELIAWASIEVHDIAKIPIGPGGYDKKSWWRRIFGG